MRVLRGRLADDSSSRVVIEIGREGPSVDLITIGEGGVIDLVHHPLTWFEFGRDGVKVRPHDQFRLPPLRCGREIGSQGIVRHTSRPAHLGDPHLAEGAVWLLGQVCGLL